MYNNNDCMYKQQMQKLLCSNSGSMIKRRFTLNLKFTTSQVHTQKH